MAATIRDVAKQAGVGLGTVSRVLNNSSLVSPATRQRVLDVIAELDYTPSQIARNFSSGKTLTIAAIVPFFTRPSAVERLRGIEATLTGNGYNLVVFNVETAERRAACLREVPRRDRNDGVIVISLGPNAEEIAILEATAVPIVLVDTFASSMPSVMINDIEGGELATQHLIALGHQRIAFLGDLERDPLNFNFTSSRNRHVGYINALQRHGIAVRYEYFRDGLHGRYEARVLARDLLTQPDPPTAIFAASDTQAMGVLEAARDLNISVPSQLSVVGFDDIDIAEYLGLTTVRQPLFESGALGAERLLAMLEGQPPKRLLEYLPIELISRGTTAAPVRR